jgi:transaldolase
MGRRTMAMFAVFLAVIPGGRTRVKPTEWNIKLFADTGCKGEILSFSRRPLSKGFTTNPTLMRNGGVKDYEGFARGILGEIVDRPVSFEVLADTFEEMRLQAQKISSWGDNVYVKIPITNSKGESSIGLLRLLSAAGIKVNVTAITTLRQIEQALSALHDTPAAFVSIFAGRIADTGRDPIPIVAEAASLLRCETTNIELVWASPRELLNIVQAESVGCHVITLTPELLKKLDLIGRDLTEVSLDTVRMFLRDAVAAGLQL